MRYFRLSLACTLALLCAAGVAHAEKPPIKCYTNDEGVRECGNVVPPEHAQQDIELKGKTGLTLQHRERAKTREELAAEAAAKARKEAEERAAQEKSAADQILLQTYGSEEDITSARDSQISSLQSQIRISEGRIQKLDRQLDQLIAEAAEDQKKGKPVPDNVAAGIDSMRVELANQRRFVQERKAEIESINSKADGDLTRFRSLRQQR